MIRRSAQRGHAHHGWLNTYHTFSFAGYHDSDFMGVGALRVLNEDRVTPGMGFGTHPHSNYEIYSYIFRGELTHRDSLGNVETLGRGDVQFTSAGTGISHSEYNQHEKEFVHFIQIWVKPSALGLKPRYTTKTILDTEKLGRLRLIVSESGAEDSIVINQDFKMYASILEPEGSLTFSPAEGRRYFVH